MMTRLDAQDAMERVFEETERAEEAVLGITGEMGVRRASKNDFSRQSRC
jgi:hypothetical protein